MKAVFIDKDGALVDHIGGQAQPLRDALCCGAGAALRLLSRLDYRFFVVSTGAGIAHGHVDEDAMGPVAHRLADLLFRERLNLDGFYYCPHHPLGSVVRLAVDCFCRRPQPGLLLKAANDHEIDLRSSWMIGARLHDIEAGNRAGCRTLLIDNGNETEWRLGPRRIPTRIVPDLYAAALMVASEGETRR